MTQRSSTPLEDIQESIRDQFAAYVDPRFKEQPSYDEYGQKFDQWVQDMKNAARAEAFRELKEELENAADEVPATDENESLKQYRRGTRSGLLTASTLAYSKESKANRKISLNQ